MFRPWLCLVLPILSAAVKNMTAGSRCPDNVSLLKETETSLEFGPSSGYMPCTFHVLVPEDSLLLLQVSKVGIISTVDSQGNTKAITLNYTYLLGPKVDISFEVWNEEYFRANFSVVNYTAFGDVETMHLAPKTRPRILPFSKFLPGKTYVFTAEHEVAAYALGKMKDRYYTSIGFLKPVYETSLLVYNGTDKNATFFGTISGWEGRQVFSGMSIYVAPFITDDPDEVRPSAKWNNLVVMPAGYFSTYSRPDLLGIVNYKPSYYVDLNATYKRTFFAAVQDASEDINTYRLTELKHDAEVLVIRGFPSDRIFRRQIVRRLRSSDMKKGYALVLDGLKSMVLLKGTLSFVYGNVYGWPQAKDGLRGLIRTERNDSLSVLYIEKLSGDTDVYRYDFDCTARDSSGTLYVEGMAYMLDLPNDTSITTAKEVRLTVYGKAEIEFTVRRVDNSSSTTTEKAITTAEVSLDTGKKEEGGFWEGFWGDENDY